MNALEAALKSLQSVGNTADAAKVYQNLISRDNEFKQFSESAEALTEPKRKRGQTWDQ